MEQSDTDAKTSYVRVRPSASTSAQQFLTALIPVATAAWASRTRVDALSADDSGAGAVIGFGSSLDERWIFARSGASGKSAGDLVLSGAHAAVTARDASGNHLRAALFGAGQISDQSGARLLLSTTSATAIEASIQGTVLAVTGSGIADFQAYAPAATSVMINGQPAGATFEAGMVTYPASSVPCCAPPPDAGAPDAGIPEIDAGIPETDAGIPETDGGAPETDAGTTTTDAGTE